MKKFLVVALSALLLLALFIPAVADSNPVLTTTVDKSSVQRGEEIAISVVLDKNVSTRNIALQYQFDSSAFTYKNKSGKWSNEIKMNGLDADVFTATAGDTSAVFGADPAIDVSAGTIFTLTLTVNADAPFGTYEIKMIAGEQFPATCVAATVTVTHNCTPASTYSNDTNNHWKACTVAGCEVKHGLESHKFDNACDATCDTCGYTRTITHDYSNLQKNGTEHWFLCTVCGTEEPGTRASHSGGSATCKQKAVCATCHAEYGSVLEHTPAPESEDIQVAPADCATPAQYKKKCSACGDPYGDAFPKGTPDASLHSGGTATCTAKAICQHCSQPYGTVNANNHVGPQKDEKSSTEHWKVCQACSAEVADSRAAHTGGTATCVDKKVCTVCSTAYGEVDATKHTGSTKIEKNATEHWTVCNSCSAEIADSRTAHTGGTATCVDKKVCTVCSQAYGEVDATKHTGTTKIEKNATEHWTVCNSCSAEIADSRAAHTGGTATCVDKKVCTVCSQAYGDVDATKHTGTTKTEKNATEHWTVCNSCSAEIADSRAAHTGGTATCKDKAVCTVCSQAYGAIDPDNHTGNNIVLPAEPSTCTVLGKKEGLKCADCEVIISQEAEDALAPHIISEWTVVKPASETEEGEKKGKCEVCGTEFTVKTDKLASTLKEENLVLDEGAKIELGETKLPENTVAAVVEVTGDDLKDVEKELKNEVAATPEIAGKSLLGATAVMIETPLVYEDPATGETICDGSDASKLPGKVKVTAPISADLSNYEGIVVMVMDAEGKMTKVDATVQNGVVVFETDSALGGVLVFGSEKQAPAPTTPGAQTGDASHVALFITLAIVSLLSLGIVSKKAKASK